MIEDLMTTAVNEAIRKAKQLHSDAMKSLAGGLEVPGLDTALADMLGENEPESS